MPRLIKFRVGAAVAVLALSLCAVPASADLIGPIFEIEATNGLHTASIQIMGGGTWSDGEYNWAPTEDMSIVHTPSGTVLGTLMASGTSMTYVEDPQVNLAFVVQAGLSDTVFTISSALLTFPNIPAAQGTASAGLSVTDTNGNGATLTGLHTGGGSYLANYNGFVPGGSLFAELLPTVSTPNPFDTAVAAAGTGPFAPIGSVSDMSTQFKFSLTAEDSASGTSTFVVVPGPGGMAVLLIGMLAGRRRRRS